MAGATETVIPLLVVEPPVVVPPPVVTGGGPPVEDPPVVVDPPVVEVVPPPPPQANMVSEAPNASPASTAPRPNRLALSTRVTTRFDAVQGQQGSVGARVEPTKDAGSAL